MFAALRANLWDAVALTLAWPMRSEQQQRMRFVTAQLFMQATFKMCISAFPTWYGAL